MTWTDIWGEGRNLNTLQMCARGFAMFFVGLILVLVTGRRSFGLSMPFDIVITLSNGILRPNDLLPVTRTNINPTKNIAKPLAHICRVFKFLPSPHMSVQVIL